MKSLFIFCSVLFVREVVNNAALQFLYYTTSLGKMFPDSDHFPLLQVAIRAPLDLSPQFPTRQAEVIHAITSPTHNDGNDELRQEISAVFPPTHITACEVVYQDRKHLKELQNLEPGCPYLKNAQDIIGKIKKIAPFKLTPKGMEMNGEDLAEMVQNLFYALENGNIAVLESAYERLEKQKCDKLYKKLIEPLLSMTDDQFLNCQQEHLRDFENQCKVESYQHCVKQEVETKKSSIIQKREAEKERNRAEQEERLRKEKEKEAQAQREKAAAADREARMERKRASDAVNKAEEARKIARREVEEFRRETRRMARRGGQRGSVNFSYSNNNGFAVGGACALQ